MENEKEWKTNERKFKEKRINMKEYKNLHQRKNEIGKDEKKFKKYKSNK